jgi:hypothetical protein
MGIKQVKQALPAFQIISVAGSLAALWFSLQLIDLSAELLAVGKLTFRALT